MKAKSFVPVILMLVKWSGIAITDGRGKVGGSVLSKSRAGATVRNKVTGVNRRSPSQSAVRAVFGSLSQAWRTLTQAQRNGWIALANSGFTVTNIFGDIVRRSGNALYVALNANLAVIGNAPIQDAPNLDDVAAGVFATDVVADVSASTIFTNIEFEGGSTTVPSGNKVVVYATPKLSAGVSYVKSQLRVIAVIPAASDTSTTNIYDKYSAKFGAPAVGDNIVMAMYCINTSSGASGVPLQQPITIQA